MRLIQALSFLAIFAACASPAPAQYANWASFNPNKPPSLTPAHFDPAPSAPVPPPPVPLVSPELYPSPATPIGFYATLVIYGNEAGGWGDLQPDALAGIPPGIPVRFVAHHWTGDRWETQDVVLYLEPAP